MIRLIAAIDRSRGIAKHGTWPWNIPEDLVYFADQTKKHGGVVLMGKNTFYTLKGPLKDRQNFVLTGKEESIEGAEVIHDIWKFLNESENDIWVAGGASVYEQAIHDADELYLTEIDADFACDQFFPEFHDRFKLESQTGRKEQNGFFYTYSIYKKAE